MEFAFLAVVLVQLLFWPAVIIAAIVFFRRRAHKVGSKRNTPDALRITFSREDTVAQLSFLLSFLFLGLAMYAVMKELGHADAWRTVMLVTVIAGMIGAYRVKAFFVLICSTFGGILWWLIQASDWMEGKVSPKAITVFSGFCLLSLIVWVVGHLHMKDARFKRYALFFQVVGALFIIGVTSILSTKAGIAAIGYGTQGAPVFVSWQVTLSLIIFFLLLAGLSAVAMAQKLFSLADTVITLALGALFGMLAFLPEQAVFVSGYGRFWDMGVGDGTFSGVGLAWAVTFNILAVVLPVALMYSGYRRHEPWRISISAILLAILIVTKYFDWFFSFLDKSVFFIGAGVLCLAVVWGMEKGRRRMIAEIAKDGSAPTNPS